MCPLLAISVTTSRITFFYPQSLPFPTLASMLTSCCFFPLAMLLSGIYVSIPYRIGTDIAAGLGLGQAIIITYFHLGRDFQAVAN